MNHPPASVLNRFASYAGSFFGVLFSQGNVLHRGAGSFPQPQKPAGAAPQPDAGLLILNADDWGRDRETTDRILDCVACKGVSSVSAMVFMDDSERAAAIARERGIDAGLHLNLTTAFSASNSATRLKDHQQRLSRHLLRHRLAPVLFHPGLTRSFEYVVSAQITEFHRLYGVEPGRVDGHHHMHLCSNVLIGGLLPPGTIVRRNFSFQPAEKSSFNRFYRQVVDRELARRHRCTDYFFALPPLEPASRLDLIFSLAHRFFVEVETHPADPQEHRFLTQGEIFRRAKDLRVAPNYVLPRGEQARKAAIC